MKGRSQIIDPKQSVTDAAKREPKVTGNLFPQTNGLHDLEDPRSRGPEPDIHDGYETVSATNYLRQRYRP
jgi:hypothetical protein